MHPAPSAKIVRFRNKKKLNMNRTTYITAILVLVLTFSACGNKSRQVEPTMMEERDSFIIDSLPPIDRPDEGRYDNIPPPPPPPGDDGCHPPHHGPKPDNMRGFDPASEDDMDDNGMSRYMENNDEEGWD